MNGKIEDLQRASDNLYKISMQNNKENFENHAKDNFITINNNPNIKLQLNDNQNKSQNQSTLNRRNSI